MVRTLLDLLGLQDETAAGEDDTEGAGKKSAKGDADDEREDNGGRADEEDGGFAPSRLDASVLEAHGMGSTAAERELASIEAKAEQLESERPDEHRE